MTHSAIHRDSSWMRGTAVSIFPRSWVRYKKSRDIQGTPKNVTVSLEADHWYVSILAEIEIPDPVHPSQEAVGLDAGVVRLLTLSDGSFIAPIDAMRKYEEKIASLQQELSRKEKGSSNYKKVQARIAKIYDKVVNTRKDYLHKVTTEISRKFGIVVIENLLVRNMTRSAKGTVEEPGHNVKAKSGLNKAILDQGWYELRKPDMQPLRAQGQKQQAHAGAVQMHILRI